MSFSDRSCASRVEEGEDHSRRRRRNAIPVRLASAFLSEARTGTGLCASGSSPQEDGPFRWFRGRQDPRPGMTAVSTAGPYRGLSPELGCTKGSASRSAKSASQAVN